MGNYADQEVCNLGVFLSFKDKQYGHIHNHTEEEP